MRRFLFLIPLVTFQYAVAAGGDYTLDFSAADPAAYQKYVPSQLACPAPGGGRVADPINAPAGQGIDQATFGSPKSSVESLSPPQLGLGQIIPFEIEICARDTLAVGNPENGTIQMTIDWSTETTSGKPFGYDETYGVYCAVIDPSDAVSANLDGDETVSFTSSIINGDTIRGVFTVSGLQASDCVSLEPWLVLDAMFPTDGANGSVHAKVDSAQTATGDKINTGAETIPLNEVEHFSEKKADVNLQKGAAPDKVGRRSQLQYTIETSNTSANTVAQHVVITDTLDPNTEFISAVVTDSIGSKTECSHDGSTTGGVLTCNAGFLSFLETVSVNLKVKVLTSARLGVAAGQACSDSEPLCNRVVISVLNDSETTNNSASAATSVVAGTGPLAAISIDKTPNADVVYSGTSVLYVYHVKNTGTGAAHSLSVTDDKCAPVAGPAFTVGNNDVQLEPGETWSYSCSSVLTADTTNTGTVTGTDSTTGIELMSSNQAFVKVIAPELQLDKIASTTSALPGTSVTYSYNVTNAGKDRIDSTFVSDDKCAPVIFASVQNGDANTDFEPGETWVFTCSQVINTTTTNTAQAFGKDSALNPVVSNQDSVTVEVLSPTPTPGGPGIVNPAILKEVQFALDANAGEQRALVNQIAARLKQLAPRSASIQRLAASSKARASNLFTQNWTLAWSLTAVVQNCPPTDQCMTQGVGKVISSYATNAAGFDALVRELVKNGRRIGMSKRSAKGYLAESRKLLNSAFELRVRTEGIATIAP